VRDGRIVEHSGGSKSLDILLQFGLVKWTIDKKEFKAFNGAFFMINLETAGMFRLVGLIALAISSVVWALAERSGHRRTLVSLSAAAALLSARIYFLGVIAASDSGASRLLPRFP